MTHRMLAAPAIASLALITTSADTTSEKYWPQWRGPHATGVSKTADPPIEWSETRNVRWKLEIPGRGSGTPVIWGDKVFVLTAVPVGVDAASSHAARGGTRPAVPHKFTVMAIDRKTGKVAWERTAREATPHEGSHQQFGTYASSSAITDGERVYAFFDSFGLYAYDMNGTPLWEKDLGDKKMRNEFGEGQTPVLHGNTIVVQWDHQGPSFITALDKMTGKELWRTERQEIDSWGTPLVVEHGGRAQVIASAMNKVTSYDLATGQVVWQGPGLTMNPIPSSVHENGMVYAVSGFRGNKLLAIQLDEAKGDLTATRAVKWELNADTPYVPSPLLYDGIIYLLKSNSGILSAFDAKTGKPHYQLQRLENVPNVFASPVGAKGRIYIPGQEGSTIVLKAGPSYDVLARNTLDDGFNASPALVDNELYLRGAKFLYSIGTR
ncbi:MAG TPA: PQQ-binding-like beta-propeller repeat protein [Vicinamibacterales bacterium]|nr:PQQ-binding-like beta-propeller repeat protein [Vicinamibacterales bacterium]